MIALLSALLYRSGGVGKNDRFLPFLPPPTRFANKLFRWLMGIPISIYTGNPWCILTYYIATNWFSYGEKHPLTKLFGKFNWFISGFAFGAASFDIYNALWCGCLFFILLWISEKDYLDNAYREVLCGGLGTMVLLWR